jgi:hypothetical protein
MYWASFLHMYQPPTQKPYWVKRVAEESYRPVFRGLVERPGVKMTININAVLVELLDQNGYGDVIADIRTLLEREQIELTASAKYHPLLPFLPKDEVLRQIKLNDNTHHKYFGDAYKPKGFFPPEMAFSMDVAKIAAEAGLDWIIVDELSFPKGQKIDYGKRYTVDGLGDFGIYFRERRTSWTILSGQIGTGRLLLESLGKRLDVNEYLLTAMDGETFGHHRPGLEQLLFEMTDIPELPTVTISELADKFPQTLAVTPTPSTWALMEKDLERNAPFARWKDPDNDIHDLQWQLTDMAISLRDRMPKQANGENQLDQALHSDQYWWASAKPWWSIEMIELGAKELFDSIRTAEGVDEATVAKAKDLYHGIVFAAFDWQRSGKVDELAKSEDEDIRQRTDEAVPRLPKAEIEKMVDNLREELKQVVSREEFERAAQIRNRIAELRSYSADVETPQTTAEGAQEWNEV